MSELRRDPEWVRRDAERSAKEKARIARRLKEIESEHLPLLAELATAGVRVRVPSRIQLTLPRELRPGQTPVSVHSISDLINTEDSYPEAIPVLVKHLQRAQHPIMVSSIARALTVKETRGTPAAQVILEKLKQTVFSSTQSGDEYQARWALANALTVAADTGMTREISDLARDESFRDVKERLEVTIRNLKRARGIGDMGPSY